MDDKQKLILSKVKELPPVPQIASRVIQICEKPDFNFSEILMFVSKDISLTTSILKFANSVIFSPISEIKDLRQAMTFMGATNLKNLIISLSVESLYNKNIDFISQKIWEHSVAVSIFSRLVALLKKPDIASEAFTLGMMHDVGQIIFKISFPEYEEFVEVAFNNDLPLAEVERNFIGFDHAELGGYTMKVWKMPGIFIKSIYFHHDPWKSSDPLHTFILAYSNMAVKEFTKGIDKKIDSEILKSAKETLSITDAQEKDLKSSFMEIYSNEKEIFRFGDKS